MVVLRGLSVTSKVREVLNGNSNVFRGLNGSSNDLRGFEWKF